MESSTPGALLHSLLFSYILSGLLLAATSFALYKFHLKESQVAVAVNGIYLLSCALRFKIIISLHYSIFSHGKSIDFFS